jgi:hypothetical protein
MPTVSIPLLAFCGPAACIARASAFGVCALAFACTHARADCIDDAAGRHQVNAQVLRAIGWQESRLRPDAVGVNANGSVDVGAFQINSVHLATLARYGIAREALADGCVCADVAAWHYRRQVDALGNTWAAVGAYHSRTPARAAWYANQVAAILVRWQVMPPGPLPYDGTRTLAPAPPRRRLRLRSSGVAPAPPASVAVQDAADGHAAPRTFSTLPFLAPAH